MVVRETQTKRDDELFARSTPVQKDRQHSSSSSSNSSMAVTAAVLRRPRFHLTGGRHEAFHAVFILADSPVQLSAWAGLQQGVFWGVRSVEGCALAGAASDAAFAAAVAVMACSSRSRIRGHSLLDVRYSQAAPASRRVCSLSCSDCAKSALSPESPRRLPAEPYRKQ